MELDFVRALGVRVVEVEQLGTQGRFLPSLNLLLIDSELDNEARERISLRALPLIDQRAHR